MRVELCWAVFVLGGTACGGARTSLESPRPESRARIELPVPQESQPKSAGSGASDAASPVGARRPSDARATVRVGETHSVTIAFEVPEAADVHTVNCSAFTLTVVGATSGVVGERLELQAHSGASDKGAVAYAWGGPEQLEPAEDVASFRCDAPGQYDLSLRLVSPAECATELPFSISCEERG